MPKKLEKIFEKEYGKRKGRLIFYKYESKHHLHPHKKLHKHSRRFEGIGEY